MIKEWEGVSSHSRVHALPARPWAGQLSRVLASLVGCGVLAHWLTCTVHGAPDHIAGYSISAHGPVADILGVAI